MLNLDNLTEDMQKSPYGLDIRLLRLNLRSYIVKIVNFAHLQITNKKALGFSIELHFIITENNDIKLNDDGNLLKAAVEAVRIIYNLQLRQTKLKKKLTLFQFIPAV